MLTASSHLPVVPPNPGFQATDLDIVHTSAIDLLLRKFVSHAATAYDAAGIGAPWVLGTTIRAQQGLVGVWGGPDGFPCYSDSS